MTNKQKELLAVLRRGVYFTMDKLPSLVDRLNSEFADVGIAWHDGKPGDKLNADDFNEFIDPNQKAVMQYYDGYLKFKRNFRLSLGDISRLDFAFMWNGTEFVSVHPDGFGPSVEVKKSQYRNLVNYYMFDLSKES